MATRAPSGAEQRYTAALDDLRRLVAANDAGGKRLDRALRLVCDVFGMPLAKVLEWEPAADRLRVRAGIGWRDGVAGHVTIPAGLSSSAGYALAQERAVIFEDIQRTKRFTDAVFLRSHNVVSGIAVRMSRGGRVLGVLSVHQMHAREFTSREIAFLEAAAVLVAELMSDD
jgi:GAF domain-containing protein